MNEWTEQMLTLWMDFACDLREFIEYHLTLSPEAERCYREICDKYEQGNE